MFLTDLLFATENHFANRELITMVKIRMTQAQKNQTGYQDFLAITKLAGTSGISTRIEVLEKHDNFCYRPVKMFYKKR